MIQSTTTNINNTRALFTLIDTFSHFTMINITLLYRYVMGNSLSFHFTSIVIIQLLSIIRQLFLLMVCLFLLVIIVFNNCKLLSGLLVNIRKFLLQIHNKIKMYIDFKD